MGCEPAVDWGGRSEPQPALGAGSPIAISGKHGLWTQSQPRVSSLAIGGDTQLQFVRICIKRELLVLARDFSEETTMT